MRLPPPDPLSTILLYIGAITMALNAALTPGGLISKAFPSLTMDGVWPFVPVLLMTLAGFIWVFRALFERSKPTPSGSSAVPAAPEPQRTPWISEYYRGFIILMSVMIIYSFAMAIKDHLFPAH